MVLSDDERRRLRTAFLEAPRDGYSLDRCIADDTLRPRVVRTCQRAVRGYSEQDYLWDLQNQRKASRLGPHATQRDNFRHEAYRHAAEIAARLIEDLHGATVDRLLCNPEIRREFDRIAQDIAPNVDPARLRLAALALRKASRLRPELAVRMGHGRSVGSVRASDVRAVPRGVPSAPGIYIIRDPSGILYIGEAGNLRNRVRQHVDHSTSAGLARYFWDAGLENCTIDLHTFPRNQAARRVDWRRAYERELITSRRPRFNIEFNRARDGR